MTYSSFLFGFILLFFIFNSCQRQTVEEFPLNERWEYKHPDSATWREATVPGVIHLDLFRTGQINDPFFGENEQNQTWIGKKDWIYKTSFPGAQIKNRQHAELVFEGLDTYADVYLNDSLLIRTNNMFRVWNIDVTELIRDTNQVFIRFMAPEPYERARAGFHPYPLPEIRGFTRKAPYQYGWDWGPKFLTMGVWKPCYVRAWDDFRIRALRMVPERITDTLAQYMAVMEVLSAKSQEVTIRYQLMHQNETKKTIQLQEGLNPISLLLDIPQPRLWWPRGLGEQHLYHLSVEVQSAGSTDNRNLRFGVREAELIQERDSIGESFYFRINGIPVFVRGANFVPMDNFLPRVPEISYQKLIESAVSANMNMLRVWGGGVYEKELFYNLCDEYGLMVWQDFMFACNLYPADTSFLDNVHHEAAEQVTRLSNHPSVVLWCGNNEVDEGLVNWGWQETLGFSDTDSIQAWKDYTTLFHKLLPGIVDSLAPMHSYISSSPKIGWGHEEAIYSGDMHYWGVWWGEKPFEVYEQKVGRFMSEYGFQGFPPPATLDSVLYADQKELDHPALQNHQKHPRGMELIRLYMERDFPVPEELFRYNYVSQLVQAYGIRKAIEAHRRAKPVCMGTLYWQLNDCWPVISWSSLDYYGRWKALHYTVRESYHDLLVSFEVNGKNLEVFVVSELQKTIKGTLVVRLMEFDGTVKTTDSLKLTLHANESRMVFSRTYSQSDAGKKFIHAVFREEEGKRAENLYYFVSPGDLELIKPDIEMNVSPEEGSWKIQLSSTTLVKDLYLYTVPDGFFTDNYFDMLPGVPVEVKFIPSSEIPAKPETIRIMHLQQIQTSNEGTVFNP